ncbi:ABC transporter ATP-binding protein [Brevibacillus laterosporus]|uniref:ABC transporter ATP-binding protein n=1 Tax=Brevibacillus laterosporus TaxID=1465 RepID=UPI002656C2DF|nr:ABC transporter ATP-binding protein [Brevibacillus laterosporus]MDN9011882.1 ABC transporter ATP-binding protein [Brevibacillus laterosporus]MDO0942978.1 ABC transporter ATP-binding protein [Brevibacillus laterosporus]
MLSLYNVNKVIDEEEILHNISFEIPRGVIVGLVGRNGSGKTTLLRTIMGILDTDGGSVELDGRSIHQHPECKKDMLYVPDSPEALHFYTPDECAKLYKAMYPNFDYAYYVTLMERFKLPRRKKIRQFSKGMKALTSLILAFSSKVSLIILDEPTNGIDPIVKKQVLGMIVEEVAQREVSFIISSHQLEELERIADMIIMIKKGSVEATTSQTDSEERFKKFQVVFKGEAPQTLLDLPQVYLLQQVGRVHTLLLEDPTGSALTRLQEEQPLLLEKLPVDLEDLFITKLGGDDYVS